MIRLTEKKLLAFEVLALLLTLEAITIWMEVI